MDAIPSLDSPGNASSLSDKGCVTPPPAYEPSDVPSAGTRMTFSNFKRLRLLGSGDVGRVYLAQLVGTDRLFAMKVLPKKDMIERKKIKRVFTEREILLTTDHPFIVTMFWSFSSANCLYFAMEYCAGGEFFRMLQRQPEHCLQEHAAKFYAAEVLLALEYLHMLGFIYRDLKPQNILMQASGHIVLTDFDLSKTAAICKSPRMLTRDRLITEPGVLSNSLVGTAEYIAPEVLTGLTHSSSVDWWAFGVLLYHMLYGSTPFVGADRRETMYNILHGDGVRFPEDHPYKVSSSAQGIIKALLKMDSAKRLGSEQGACELKAHSFFKGTKWGLLRNQTPPIVPELTDEYDTRMFAERRDDGLIDRLEAAACASQANERPEPTTADDPFKFFDSAKGPSSYLEPPVCDSHLYGAKIRASSTAPGSFVGEDSAPPSPVLGSRCRSLSPMSE